MRSAAVQLGVSFSPPHSVNSWQDFACTWKAHALVIGSYLLLGIGIALACTSVYMASFVHPMIAMASPALPIALGALGLTRTTETTGRVLKNWQKGQPVGLNNERNDCFLNTPLQLLFNLPAYKKRLRSISAAYEEHRRKEFFVFHPLVRGLDQYEAEQNSTAPFPLSALDTQRLRKWASKYVPDLKETHTQEDFMPFLEWVLQETGHRLPTIVERMSSTEKGKENWERIERKGDTDPTEYILLFPMDPFQKTSISMSELWERFFYEQSPGEDGVYLYERRFESPPEDMTICLLHQTVGKPGEPFSHEKLSTSVTDAFHIRGTPEQFGAAVEYDLDGFVLHVGDPANGDGGGHYRSYVKDPQGAWWHCNDQEILQATPQEIEEALAKAYCLHYQKRGTAA